MEDLDLLDGVDHLVILDLVRNLHAVKRNVKKNARIKKKIKRKKIKKKKKNKIF